MDLIVHIRTLCVVVLANYCAAFDKQYADCGTQNVMLLFNYSWTGGQKSVTCTKDKTTIGQCAGTLSIVCSIEQSSVGVYTISSNTDLTPLSLTVLHFNESTSGTYSCSKPSNTDTKTICLEKTPALHLEGYKTINTSFLINCTISSDVHKVHWITYTGTKPVIVATQEYVNDTRYAVWIPGYFERFCNSKMVYTYVIEEWIKGQIWGCSADINGITTYSNNYTIPALYLAGYASQNNSIRLECTISSDVYKVHWMKYNDTRQVTVATLEYVNGTCIADPISECMLYFCNSTRVYTCVIKISFKGQVWGCYIEINGNTAYSNNYTIPLEQSGGESIAQTVGVAIGATAAVALGATMGGIVISKKRRHRETQRNSRTLNDNDGNIASTPTKLPNIHTVSK